MLHSYKKFLDARSELKRRYVPHTNFEALEESCIPSYTHSNWLMGWVAWRRLDVAVALWRRFGGMSPVLDFGAGSGILRTLLPEDVSYHYTELDEGLAQQLQQAHPDATRVTSETPKTSRYQVIFALDSLEHNEDISSLLLEISARLGPKGIFILSGPSENLLYRFGRRLAGFGGHYHAQTIYDIERAAESDFERIALKAVPFGLPLFRISAWRKREIHGQ